MVILHRTDVCGEKSRNQECISMLITIAAEKNQITETGNGRKKESLPSLQCVCVCLLYHKGKKLVDKQRLYYSVSSTFLFCFFPRRSDVCQNVL